MSTKYIHTKQQLSP